MRLSIFLFGIVLSCNSVFAADFFEFYVRYENRNKPVPYKSSQPRIEIDLSSIEAEYFPEGKRMSIFPSELEKKLTSKIVENIQEYSGYYPNFKGEVQILWAKRLEAKKVTPSPTTNPNPPPSDKPTPAPTTPPSTTKPTPIPVGDNDFEPQIVVGSDMSFEFYKPQEMCQWYRGKTANQTEAARKHHAWSIYVPRAIHFGETVPSCHSNLRKWRVQNLQEITRRLAGDYVLKRMNSDWAVKTGCNVYQNVQQTLVSARECALKDPISCAKSPWADSNDPKGRDFLDALDLDVQDGKCISGSPNQPAPNGENFDKKKFQNEGKIDFRVTQPALGPEQLSALHKLHDVHEKTGHGGTATASDWNRASKTLIATGRTPVEKHALQMPIFPQFKDPAWTPEELHVWSTIKHAGHGLWTIGNEHFGRELPQDVIELAFFPNELTKPIKPWVITAYGGTVHQLAHVCTALKRDYLVQFPCGKKSVAACPRVTCEEWLQMFRDGLNEDQVKRGWRPVPWLKGTHLHRH